MGGIVWRYHLRGFLCLTFPFSLIVLKIHWIALSGRSGVETDHSARSITNSKNSMKTRIDFFKRIRSPSSRQTKNSLRKSCGFDLTVWNLELPSRVLDMRHSLPVRYLWQRKLKPVISGKSAQGVLSACGNCGSGDTFVLLHWVADTKQKNSLHAWDFKPLSNDLFKYHRLPGQNLR